MARMKTDHRVRMTTLCVDVADAVEDVSTVSRGEKKLWSYCRRQHMSKASRGVLWKVICRAADSKS